MAGDASGEVSTSNGKEGFIANPAFDLDRLVEKSPFSYCRGKLLRTSTGSGSVIPCSDLREAATLNDVISRYASKFPGSDRRAVVSMWTLYYFSILTVAPCVHLFAHRIGLPLGLSQVSIVCNEDTAEPEAFLMTADTFTAADPGAELHNLLLGHVEPLVEAIAAHAVVAPKLLWNNVAAYLAWILKEIAYKHSRERVEDGLALLDEPIWPDGRRNPMHGMIRIARQQCGLEFSRRKICCLRYNLPGVGGCGEACPVPDGRQ
ncbi:ferric iron reductase protein FhuF [Neorhizobium sp. R1-B]|uniref:siderophore-iron reductase FhuF n=1 Tax=Neorhizobium sp. R1-B TaxID=2485162 RepID=UPI001065C476|nr:siderophore-iron reductase FhuF [Neorhizobium sp. R1-B]TDX85552.1 ferric iron reductase protein FhuF [Neorhizobium sp. R1-B]